jgi:NADH-quinone oxidoreductase subunit J
VTLYVFYFLSFVAVLSALIVVFAKNPVYSVIFLVITFFCIACHYMLLSAQFLAAVHVIVYAGAIMVLFLYVIMLLNLNQESEPQKSTLLKIAGTITGGLLLVVFVGVLRSLETVKINPGTIGNLGSVKSLGKVLLSDFLLPFEAVSILLLAAMVGAVMLGKTHRKNKRTNNVSGIDNGSRDESINTAVEELTHER